MNTTSAPQPSPPPRRRVQADNVLTFGVLGALIVWWFVSFGLALLVGIVVLVVWAVTYSAERRDEREARARRARGE